MSAGQSFEEFLNEPFRRWYRFGWRSPERLSESKIDQGRREMAAEIVALLTPPESE